MAKLRIKRINASLLDPALELEINGFCDQHMGTVFHETDFNRIASRVFKTDLSYFLAYQDKTLVGVMPCQTFNNRLIRQSFSNLSSFEIPYGGWVFDKHLVQIDKLVRKTPLGMNESLGVMSNIELDMIQRPTLRLQRQEILNTVLLSLEGKGTDELFGGLSKKLRNKIRHASAMGIEVIQLVPENLDLFFDLFRELKNRVGLRMRDVSFYSDVFGHYQAQARATCLTALYENVPISSMILLANSNFTTAWVAGRKSGLPNNLYQNELLIWESIKWANEFGSQYFDLCGLDEERLPHLARIKLSFSKDIRNFYFYLKRSPAYPLLNKAQNILRRYLDE